MTADGSGTDGWDASEDELGDLAAHPDPELSVRLRWLPRGVRRIGLSDQELAAARALAPLPDITVEELTPVVEIEVGPAWVGELPLTAGVACHLGIDQPDVPDVHPARLTRAEAIEACGQLGGRLPSEAEWETCARAGSSPLFPWGDELLPDESLEPWLAWNLDGELARNPAGFGGLFFGEWCSDEFRVSHAPGAPTVAGAHVIKGGGAQFWPWQDQEWVWCMPAMRMPSTDLFADGRAAARLVMDVPAK